MAPGVVVPATSIWVLAIVMRSCGAVSINVRARVGVLSFAAAAMESGFNIDCFVESGRTAGLVVSGFAEAVESAPLALVVSTAGFDESGLATLAVSLGATMVAVSPTVFSF